MHASVRSLTLCALVAAGCGDDRRPATNETAPAAGKPAGSAAQTPPPPAIPPLELAVVPHQPKKPEELTYRIRAELSPPDPGKGSYAWVAQQSILSDLAEAGVGAGTDARDGVLTLTLVEKEHGRFEITDSRGRSTTTGSRFAFDVTFRPTNPGRELEVSFSGKPPSIHLQSSNPAEKAFEAMRESDGFDDVGLAVAAALGDAEATATLIERAGGDSAFARKIVKQFGLQVDPQLATAKDLMRKGDVAGCESLGAVCARLARSFLRQHENDWLNPGALGLEFRAAVDVLGRMGDRNDMTSILDLLDRTADERSHVTMRDELWKTALAGLERAGGTGSLIVLADHAEHGPEALRAMVATARDKVIARLAERGTAAGKVALDVRIVSDLPQSINIEPMLENLLTRVGLTAVPADAPADGYVIAFYRATLSSDYSGEISVLVVDARTKEAFGPYRFSVSNDSLPDAEYGDKKIPTLDGLQLTRRLLEAAIDCALATCSRRGDLGILPGGGNDLRKRTK